MIEEKEDVDEVVGGTAGENNEEDEILESREGYACVGVVNVDML